MNQRIINLGIVAHVDAGKTSITETMLHLSGAIRKKGNVDSGTTISDSMAIERKRGVSVKSSSLSFNWKDVQINLIDTPGHNDFSAEVERVFSILDLVILVVSAVEGIQSHSFWLWDRIKEMKIPAIVFINKTDRAGADTFCVLSELKYEFLINPVPIYVGDEDEVSLLKTESVFENRNLNERFNSFAEIAFESLAEIDEDFMVKYLDGKDFKIPEIDEVIRKNIRKDSLNLVFTGIAKEGIGIEELLNGIVNYFEFSEFNEPDFSALVFKVEHHEKFGRLAHLKLFSGELTPRQSVFNKRLNSEVKIALLKKKFTNKLEDLQQVFANDVCVVSGLSDVISGDVLGKSELVPENKFDSPSIFTVQIKSKDGSKYGSLGEALSILNSEDPELNFLWFKDEKEMHLCLRGKMQMEIIDDILKERFNIETEFSDPTIIYKETPQKRAFGFAEYTMPKPCWAVVKFLIEPGQKGSGLVYSSEVSFDKIHKKYQNEIEECIPKALEQGINGWQVTDVKITLVEGEDHEIHSRPGDFNIAVPMAIMDGLNKAGIQFLEPVLEYQIKTSSDFLGAISSELHSCRAELEPVIFNGENVEIKAKVPASTTIDFPVKLASITGGMARLVSRFKAYEKCDSKYAVKREYKGVNPMDRSKWILHARGAYKADSRRI